MKCSASFDEKTKNMGAKAPMQSPALAAARPIMTCTKWQVGCRSQPFLLPTSIRRQSADGRSANQL